MAQTVARVDLSILIENIDLVRNRVPRGMKVLFAVKSDAYGHGIEEISRSAEAAGIDYLGVDTVDEGVEIRSAGIKLPILLLAPILPCEIDRALQSDLTPSIGDIDSARLIANRARGMGRRASVQVNVDTGMGRFGARVDRGVALFERLSQVGDLTVEGVFSHLSFAESETSEAREHSLLQIERFRTLLASLDDAHLLPSLRHIGNSASLIQFPQSILSAPFNMVRIGTLLYGYPEVRRPSIDGVRPIAKLSAYVLFVKDLPIGACVGYDCTYRTTEAKRIAVVSIGYGSGLSPTFSGCGRVYVRGEYAPVVGRICLDHTIIDVSHVRNVAPGDEVEIFGPHQGADQLASLAGISICQLLVPTLQAAKERTYLRGRKELS